MAEKTGGNQNWAHLHHLGQLTTVVDGLDYTVFNTNAAGSHNANGNLMQSRDGPGIRRQKGYDALNRLVQTIDN